MPQSQLRPLMKAIECYNETNSKWKNFSWKQMALLLFQGKLRRLLQTQPAS